MCLVEVKPGRKPQASCALQAAEGQEFFTGPTADGPGRPVKGDGVPARSTTRWICPICDQGGECDLADRPWAMAATKPLLKRTMRGGRREVPWGPLIKTGHDPLHPVHPLRPLHHRGGRRAGHRSDHRGEDVEITTYLDKAVSSELSANVIDLCPVGALTSKPYAFNAGPGS
jgi:NADH-quinone oxidoreductase subunit G